MIMESIDQNFDTKVEFLGLYQDFFAQPQRLAQGCICSHTKYKKPIGMDELPRRLIDVRGKPFIEVFDVQHRLRSGTATLAQLANFATLNYMWGDSLHSCVRRRHGLLLLPFNSLPQTFKAGSSKNLRSPAGYCTSRNTACSLDAANV